MPWGWGYFSSCRFASQTKIDALPTPKQKEVCGTLLSSCQILIAHPTHTDPHQNHQFPNLGAPGFPESGVSAKPTGSPRWSPDPTQFILWDSTLCPEAPDEPMSHSHCDEGTKP